MRQGNRSVTDYAIDFCTKARQSDWNFAALSDAYLHGLADYIKDELMSHTFPSTLDGCIELTTRIDQCICARRRERSSAAAEHSVKEHYSSSSGTPSSILTIPKAGPVDSEPKQLGHIKLSLEEQSSSEGTALHVLCPGRTFLFLTAQ